MIIMASDNETETCKQVESPGVNVNPEDTSKEEFWAALSKLCPGFSSMGERKKTEEEQHMI